MEWDREGKRRDRRNNGEKRGKGVKVLLINDKKYWIVTSKK